MSQSEGCCCPRGPTHEQALADVQSAIQYHPESFGREAIEGQPDIIEAFVDRQSEGLMAPVSSGVVVFLDSLSRVHETMHRIVTDLTPDELVREPHPPIGWLAWRLSRVMDSIPSSLAGRDQLWIADGWAARFGMKPEPSDFGRAVSHTREQVRAFSAPADLLLAYHDAVYDRTVAYFEQLTDEELARELNEPQYTPLPTVSVRLVSLIENLFQNAGMIAYLKAYHRLGGWFPAEAADRSVFR